MKPKINLCVFNHPRRTILDQIWFAKETFAQNGYELGCTATLRPDCLNLVIENFTEQDTEIVGAFCRRFGKQVGIVMTEHIELEQAGAFSFGGTPLDALDYIGNKEQRLFSLLSLSDCAFAFITFGELPELRRWAEIVPTHQVYRLPYPSIAPTVRQTPGYDYDIVFTGALTRYRESVLKRLKGKYRVIYSDLSETEQQRSELYARSKIAVNIPQTADWRWVSPMRILFGLKIGIPTIHLGPPDTTIFSATMVESTNLDSALADPEAAFREQIASYAAFAASQSNDTFPIGLLATWAELELA